MPSRAIQKWTAGISIRRPLGLPFILPCRDMPFSKLPPRAGSILPYSRMPARARPVFRCSLRVPTVRASRMPRETSAYTRRRIVKKSRSSPRKHLNPISSCRHATSGESCAYLASRPCGWLVACGSGGRTSRTHSWPSTNFKLFRLAIVLLGIIGFASTGGAQQMSSSIRSDVAPMGKLRVGINFGNALLTSRDASGTPGGIAVDLAKELARRVGVPMEIVSYEAAGQLADGAKAGAWDLAFLAADPARAEEIAFTA